MATADVQSNPKYDKLVKKLRELFQLDQADLDFGIYRIMNEKRDRIEAFLEKDLLPQVREAFSKYSEQKTEVRQELERLEQACRDLDKDPDQEPKVIELRRKLAEAPDTTAMESEVYSHLYRFFKRYYKEGDFISLRRYDSKGAYAIPYNGEEVKLHWANHDQYYIKTSERLKNYTFKVGSGRRVHFEIVKAVPVKDNNKDDRYYVVSAERPARVDGSDLVVQFEHRPVEPAEVGQKTKKGVTLERVNSKSLEQLEAWHNYVAWKDLLERREPTGANQDRTLIQKHLAHFTKSHTFDYFIHKDLGGFLRRELDFYIKSDLLHIDDICYEEDFTRIEAELTKINVLRDVAEKIITFLAQLEDFQKKLWLKKKFVVETNYCVTLDRVPQQLYAEILSNEAQLDAWRTLYQMDAWSEELLWQGNFDETFLENHPNLMVDTVFFDKAFKDRLIATFDDLEDVTDGLLIQGDNFQALNLLQDRYREKARCIYIDPPYNTESNSILYKNTFKHSSWLSLMADRLSIASHLTLNDAVHVVAIDEHEQERLGLLLEAIFPDLEKTCVTVIHNPGGTQSGNFKRSNEYAYFVYPAESGAVGLKEREDPNTWDVRPLRDVSKGNHLREDAKNCFYPIIVEDGEVVGFGEVCDDHFHPSSANIPRPDGKLEIYPIDAGGNERKWTFARQSVESIKGELHVEYNSSRGIYDVIRTKKSFNPKTAWTQKKYNSNTHGSKFLNNILGSNSFDFPKSIYNVLDCIKITTHNNPRSLVVDYFAGSGTTGHAVMHLNREDNGDRRYVLVEMGKHFETVIKPRLMKVAFSSKWKNGIPQVQNGQSHMIKYQVLESYEDALNNLGAGAGGRHPRYSIEKHHYDVIQKAGENVLEEYIISYLMSMEYEGSASLLDIKAFRDPFNYKLKVVRNDETRWQTVDLVETFNYLIGLHVKTHRAGNGVTWIRGVVRDAANEREQKVLVLWRNKDSIDNDALDAWFKKNILEHGIEFDRVYVNGDCNLAALSRDARWEVALTEEEFKKRMFNITGAF